MPIGNLNRRPVAACTVDETADALTRGFENYLVPMRMTGEQFERRFRAEHLDPYASAIWFDGKAPAIIALICRRGWTSRLAAFGVTLALRSKGLAKAAMREVIAEARDRGDHSQVLEVIDGNTAAMRLYESLGFKPVRRLVGYDGTRAQSSTKTRAREVDPAHASRLMSRFADADLPWQLHPASFHALTLPVRAFALDDEAVAFVEPVGDTARLRGLAVDPARRRQGLGRAMMNDLAQTIPKERWSLSAIMPEGLADEFFAKAGWKRSALAQQEMSLTLET